MSQITIADIVGNDLCTGCGACMSEIDKPNTSMQWDEFGFIIPTGNLGVSSAVKVCPFNISPEPEVKDEDAIADIFLKDAINIDPQIGHYNNSYVGFAKEYRESSSSGGIATYVFEQLLVERIVDNLFIVKSINGSYAYQFFNKAEQIKQISKTRYIPVTLEKLFTEIDNIEGRIAVSGIACFIKAIRLKQYYCPGLVDKIPFLVGIICGGIKSRFFSDYLASSAGIDGVYHKQEYRIKDINSTASDYSFGAYSKGNDFYTMKMSQVGDMWGSGLFKANACDFCDDVTTELADISLGDAWLKPYNSDGKGTSIIITRSSLAENLVAEGIKNGELKLDKLPLSELKKSQQGSFNHRHTGLKYRIKSKKREGIRTPTKRERFLANNLPFGFKKVQRQRMKLRQLSLNVWAATKSAEQFNLTIKAEKDKLIKYTRRYHIVRAIKRRLSL